MTIVLMDHHSRLSSLGIVHTSRLLQTFIYLALAAIADSSYLTSLSLFPSFCFTLTCFVSMLPLIVLHLLAGLLDRFRASVLHVEALWSNI